MGQHPEVWSYLNQNPTLYQSLAAKAPAYQPNPNAYALADYLHSHPGVAQALSANPALANSPAFLSQHPEFREFLGIIRPSSRRWKRADGTSAAGNRPISGAQRNQWRDADDWSDRDWHEQWERQRQIFHEREEVEEAEEHGHHDNGKHLGWYKHGGKHHEDGDADDEENHGKGHHGGGHGDHHKDHDKHHGDDD